MRYQRFKKGGRVAKRPFLRKKVCKNSLIRKWKRIFREKSTFFELPITQKQFIFEESYISYGSKRTCLFQRYFLDKDSYAIIFYKIALISCPFYEVTHVAQKSHDDAHFFWLKNWKKNSSATVGLEPQLSAWQTDVLTITPQVLHRMQGFILQWCPM